MKIINYTQNCDKDTFLNALKSQEEVNRGVDFSSMGAIPFFKFKEKGSRIKITCEMRGGATKDTQFLVGTYFCGTVKSTPTGCKISGVLLTAPI